MEYKNKGLIAGKYIVQRGDGKFEDPEAKFFVLRYDKEDAWGCGCRAALRTLAWVIENEYPQLSKELHDEMDAISGEKN